MLIRKIRCKSLAAEGDPTNQGNNASVNNACVAANVATNDVEGPYIFYSGRNYYDIAAIDPDPFPPNYYVGYLNQPHVQQALGTPVNYTNPGGNGPYNAFQSTGDYPRGGLLEDLSYLIDSGIKVALVYGDRDYACSWLGGEAASLAVAYSKTSNFQSSGYEDIHVNGTYNGGLVRQYGNFSFSRVFQAGHEVPAYQPETAYEIFHRAMFNLDIASGKISTAQNGTYGTVGASSTFSIKNKVPESPQPTCYTYALLSTCTNDQINSVIDGSALIHDYIVIDNNTAGLFPGIGNGTNSNGTSSGGGSSGTSTASGPSSSATKSGGIFVKMNASTLLAMLALSILVG